MERTILFCCPLWGWAVSDFCLLSSHSGSSFQCPFFIHLLHVVFFLSSASPSIVSFLLLDGNFTAFELKSPVGVDLLPFGQSEERRIEATSSYFTEDRTSGIWSEPFGAQDAITMTRWELSILLLVSCIKDNNDSGSLFVPVTECCFASWASKRVSKFLIDSWSIRCSVRRVENSHRHLWS